ncbi:MAG: hypothetical protein NTY38_32980 [Acidobacteria bacterium]|nr:hypothetical protein [Acidobacteriota bacterium]
MQAVLSAEEIRTLLDSIDTQILIALMGYTFARIGAVTQMKIQDYYIQQRRGRLADPRLPLPQGNVHMMIQRRAAGAGIQTKISCHSFRATGITTYVQNGGKLEVA